MKPAIEVARDLASTIDGMQSPKDILANAITQARREAFDEAARACERMRDIASDLSGAEEACAECRDACTALAEREGNPLKFGCHCDIESMDDGFTPDGCVIDIGRVDDCIYAEDTLAKGGKEKCEYWRPIAEREGE